MGLYKVSLIGPTGVGKTSIQIKASENKFVEQTLSTVGVSIGSKEKVVGNEKVEMQIWDFGGQLRFQIISDILIKGSHAVLLVFDVTRPRTLAELQAKWLPLVKAHVKNNTILYLIGNKIDLPKQVTQKEIDNVLKKQKFRYFETSAKTGAGLEDVFDVLAKELTRIKTQKRFYINI